MKDKDPEYINNDRTNKKIATRCRACGGQLLNTKEIKMEMHERCRNTNDNTYMM